MCNHIFVLHLRLLSCKKHIYISSKWESKELNTAFHAIKSTGIQFKPAVKGSENDWQTEIPLKYNLIIAAAATFENHPKIKTNP